MTTGVAANAGSAAAAESLLPRRRLQASYTPIPIPIRPSSLPMVPRVKVPSGGAASITLEPADVSVSLDAATSLSFTTPRYTVTGGSPMTALDSQPQAMASLQAVLSVNATAAQSYALQAPAIVIKAVCSNFSLAVTNNLPFQGVTSCPDAPTSVENGAHNFEWTNLHAHGLKVDPGAVTLQNICEPGNIAAGFPNATSAAPSLSAPYFCDANLSSQQLCQVYGDNIYVGQRPNSLGLAPGSTLKYTYPLGGSPPGVGWYHPHQHGSGGIQVPTAAGPLVIPESWLPSGLTDLYEPASRAVTGPFNQLLGVMRAQPLELSTILRFDGLWFRTHADGSPDDDSLPFLGGDIGGANVSPLLFDVLPDGSSAPKYTNAAGRDWGLVNGAFQPTVTLVDSTYARWQLLNTMTMKWLDLTFQQVQPDGSMTPAADCSIWLLGRDAVPLPLVPRRLRSQPPGAAAACNKPGTYVLASGAGPFHTNYDVCQATHCELFGDVPPDAFGLPRSANNLYGGQELSAAVLAVVNVVPRSNTTAAAVDLPDSVARTKLERFSYLNHTGFPQPAVEQCFSFMNAAYGGACEVNNQPFPSSIAYVREGSHQAWKLRDITFHPFHMHESPIRLTSLPPCATSVTNTWQVGDWVDVLLLPTCQNGCTWNEGSSGGGNCGNPVSVCDEVSVEWMAEHFYPQGSGYSAQSPDLCAAAGFPTTKPSTSAACQSRNSIFHCHIVPHSDEGCAQVVKWYCPDDPDVPSPAPLATCPANYTYTC
ncbi:hypothetical protein HYH02_013367 [Chlamydomonas schloesseri]|uniref:Plastocyanin-like domain-containing protein n=1 Tax=Chlamydomonas schloesseri TaxID=2026947 RepID=A0A835VXC2_9CHLO|nr:hypothetical protein HYH02_013367 [Chlamydomonas schloesseri]|eukprot:KAG2431380.1 hypothetical protein HYH02_013367 [Chlamydomonas schloesseri]